MVKTSAIEIKAALKHASRVIRHPKIMSKLIKLEAEKRFFNRLYPNRANGLARKIRQTSIRITDVCNLRCHTCGQWGDSGFLHNKDLKVLKTQEVTPERYRQVFLDLTKNGHHPIVYFWGGEPMLYEGINDLIRYAGHLGLPTAIATNGTRLEASAEMHVEAPLFLLQVSIDGHTPELQNRLRPSAGGGDNYRDIVNGLEKVNRIREEKNKGLPIIASLTVVSQDNIDHLVDLYKAFRDKVDIFVFYLSWWIGEDRAREHEQDFLSRFDFSPNKHRGWIGSWKPASYEKLDREFSRLKNISKPWNAPPVTILPPVTGIENLSRYYTDHTATFGFDQCVSIYQAVEINSNGDMSPCRDYHDFVVGNIKKNSVTELWNSPPYVKFRQSLSTKGLMPVCSRCCGLMGY